ncbi:hypothetical protein IHE44_0008242 [Lamprotornis superbus]|uniref:Uncharacterized protein n=1 Tax=Lamprotornis superbus TaxID=245042 RepID=A0A835NDI9_9PASS|nr:hypothetical protein IHE44_0008242 [Lamprotornis superbus]
MVVFLQTFVYQFPNSSQLSQPELGILEVTAPCHSLSGTVGDTVNVGILLGGHEVLAQALAAKQESLLKLQLPELLQPLTKRKPHLGSSTAHEFPGWKVQLWSLTSTMESLPGEFILPASSSSKRPPPPLPPTQPTSKARSKHSRASSR